MLWGGRWEGGSCLGTHVRIKDFKILKIKKEKKKKRKKEKGKLTFTKQLKIRYLRLTSFTFIIFKFAGELMGY